VHPLLFPSPVRAVHKCHLSSPLSVIPRLLRVLLMFFPESPCPRRSRNTTPTNQFFVSLQHEPEFSRHHYLQGTGVPILCFRLKRISPTRCLSTINFSVCFGLKWASPLTPTFERDVIDHAPPTVSKLSKLVLTLLFRFCFRCHHKPLCFLSSTQAEEVSSAPTLSRLRAL